MSRKQHSDAQASQHDRFLEAARKLGADKDDGTLDRVLGKVAPPVRPNPPKTDKEPKKAE